jgi:protein-L-isoaspartate(D-aspartate) O-methyltransferase
MVEQHIARRGVRDERVLDAMRTVPREKFISPELTGQAYADGPLPIGAGQTISQPYVVALMAAAAELTPDDRVLEIGTGSGYGAAVLGRLAAEVVTVERRHDLASDAGRRLRDLGYTNIRVERGDGTLGWLESAPYDAIVVTAGGPEVPDALRTQLADGGRLVIPVGPDRNSQSLIRERRDGDIFRVDHLGLVRFVPLVGEQGWAGRED